MSTHAAHIVTSEAADLGAPEILVVLADPHAPGSDDPVDRFPMPTDADPREVLRDHGWWMVGTADQVGTDYYVAAVERA